MIYETVCVKDQPVIVLKDWQVIEVRLPGFDVPTLHFNGYAVENHEGRVSSPIVAFDRATRIGQTWSGRQYRLQGEPGAYNEDAIYVLRRWLDMKVIAEYRGATGDIYEAPNFE